MEYIWQKKEWPNWEFDVERFSNLLSQVHLERGRLLGAMQALGFKVAAEINLRSLTNEVVKSSEIEGEKLNPASVRSSLAKKLGIEDGGLTPPDRGVEGVVEMILDATGRYTEPLTSDRLFGWHAALFPTGYSGMTKITVADYRNDNDGPMQVVSGRSINKKTVHFEAPPAVSLKSEMAYFFHWFNDPGNKLDSVLKAGLAHLWFVTLHPFDDGNGRIGRAICDMALAQSDGLPQRFYSLSAQILRERNAYYEVLEKSQKGSLEVSDWLEWFLNCLLRAVLNGNKEIKSAIYLSHLASQTKSGYLNERQMKVLNMMMHEFEGNLTTGKWAKITHCSTDTALRDIEELLKLGALEKAGETKRGTYYVLKFKEENSE